MQCLALPETESSGGEASRTLTEQTYARLRTDIVEGCSVCR
jgi:hypothetical protein